MATCGDDGGKNRFGGPCGRAPSPGHTRCSKHGAMQPEAKIRAEQALALLRLPAIDAVHDIIEQFSEQMCGTCGYPQGTVEEKRVVLNAARTILDRTGLGVRSYVEFTKQSDGDLNLELLTPDEHRELLAHLAAIRAIKQAVRERQALAGAPLDPSARSGQGVH